MRRTRTLAAIILVWACCAGTASAQGLFGRKAQAPPGASMGGLTSPPRVSATSTGRDERVITAGQEIPEPTLSEDVQPAQIQLPNEPIDPYLLPKNAGPFMINAQAFRGPQSTQYAQLLAMELRRDYKIAAYVYNNKMKPGGSNIRGTLPTAAPDAPATNLNGPERARIYDEAVVLIGDCKTEDDAEGLLKQVKKIAPKCLQGMPSIYQWRKKDLGRATITVNPWLASQQLFTRKADPLVQRLNNGGHHSISNCPGPYTLQVSEFTGRAAFIMEGDRVLDDEATLKTSPLASAADDAEMLAALLEKNPEFQKFGQKVYVFHDLNGSKVSIGSFSSANDPGLVAMGLAMNPATGQFVVSPDSKLLDIMLKTNLNGKYRNGTKVENVDASVARAKFLKMSANPDLTKGREVTAPVLFHPMIIKVPNL